MKKMIIIGLTGRMKSGKDAVADMLMNIFDSLHITLRKVSFADPLKKMLIDTFGFQQNDFYTQEGKALYNPLWGMTHREVLQKTGTEAIRKNLHPDAWVFAMDALLTRLESENVPGVIIPDVRFKNEATLIHQRQGYLLQVERPSIVTNIMKIKEALHLVHPSEQPLPKAMVTSQILNDGTLDDLHMAVENWYQNIYCKSRM